MIRVLRKQNRQAKKSIAFRLLVFKCNCCTIHSPRSRPAHDPFLVRSSKNGEPLGLEWGMILQASYIIFSDKNFSFLRMSILERVG